ncbi:biogenesis of lysosome-related organelles complex 1 subunit 4 [Pelobates cultripes]|uniref:Biogenesis of lysosome-related organelles complex 1 subunit 4 n=1 Tax=Pelobates cultripes TaxID=61616 RepID=A0AAD1S3Z3_PELCU|nr:biogenesis of lysosome-related organelles complex 1 subunit 4 [Pelobates cultripes]
MELEEGSGQWRPLDGDTGPASRGSPGDSGHVSQSHSVCSGASAGLLTEDEEEPGRQCTPPALLDHLLPAAASSYSGYVLQGEQTAEIETLEKCLEDLLIRVDEFVGMLDMIRNDTSQVMNEKVPQIYAKATEMRALYHKIDMLEAFVRKVGGNVAVMEDQVTHAETQLGTFPNPFKKIFKNISTSPLFSPTKPSSSPRAQQARYESPPVFKTEDHFPCSS